MKNQNASTLKDIMSAGEFYVRLRMDSPTETATIPTSGSIHPDQVPTALSGLAFVDTFDRDRRPRRYRVPVYLFGLQSLEPTEQSVSSSTQSAKSPILSGNQSVESSLSRQPSPLVPAQAAEQASRSAATEPEAQRQQPLTLPPPPPAPHGQDDFARDFATAQLAQLRGHTIQTEAAAASARQLEKLTLLQNTEYTRELGEWQQGTIMLQHDVAAAQSGLAEQALRNFDAVDHAAGRLLKMSDEVARRLKDPLYQPAPPPPPPPPPPVDVASIISAGIQTIGAVAVAYLARNASSQSIQADVVSMFKKQAKQNDSPQNDLASIIAGLTSQKKQDATISIKKATLLKLAESGAITLSGDSKWLATLIHSDKLHDVLNVPAPTDGVYRVAKSRLLQLTELGMLGIGGDSEGLAMIIRMDAFEAILSLIERGQENQH